MIFMNWILTLEARDCCVYLNKSNNEPTACAEEEGSLINFSFINMDEFIRVIKSQKILPIEFIDKLKIKIVQAVFLIK